MSLSNDVIHIIFNHTRHFYGLLDPQGTVLELNQRALEVIGLTHDQAVGNSIWMSDLWLQEEQPHLQEAVVQARQGESAQLQLQIRGADGGLNTLDLSLYPIKDDTGHVVYLLSEGHDITHLKKVEAQLRHDSLHDSLTGLPMRTLFMDRLEHAAIYAKRNANFRFAVFYIDLDGFKAVNDILGHDSGDNVLVSIARQLNGCVRACDTVARLSGDEFAVLLEHLSGPEDATQLAERMVRNLVVSSNVGGHEVSVSASIGVAFSGQHVEMLNLLHAADTAMYQAKAAGKARYHVFNELAS